MVRDLRLLIIIETYSIARMFRKFDEKRIINCNDITSLKSILYFAGNHHVLLVKKFFDEVLNINYTEANYKDQNRYLHEIKLNKKTKYFGYNINWDEIESKNWIKQIKKLNLKNDRFFKKYPMYYLTPNKYEYWLSTIISKKDKTVRLKEKINYEDIEKIKKRLQDKNIYFGEKLD